MRLALIAFVYCGWCALAPYLVWAQSNDAPQDRGNLKSELRLAQPREPDAARRTILPSKGFEVQLVASEPAVQDPVAATFDENGRLFVVEFPEYNHRHAGWKIARHGAVRMLTDSDGDGIYDKSSIYAEGLASPTSVACYDGGIIVCAAPDILYFKDTDGDGRADIRRKLFTGFEISEKRGGGGRLNSIRWGIDHRFHVCTSFSGGQVRRADRPESAPVDVRNRGFAFDPKTLEMEATSGAGQHGLAFDDWGHMFTCRNSDPVRLVMYESRYVKRNPYLTAPAAELSITQHGKFTKLFRRSAMEGWRVVRTRRRVAGDYRGSAEGGTPGGFFTSATGVVVYRGDAWPSNYLGNVFVGEVSNNLVHRAQLVPDKLQWVARPAESGAEFLAASDNWFRPVELLNGPDGNLYIVDMYRQLIETALALPDDVLKQLPKGAGVAHGRIYRVVPAGFQRKPVPQLGRLPTADLVALLQHRNGWHRDTAMRLLHARQDRSAIDGLRQQIETGALAEGRIAALYALRSLGALDERVVTIALQDGDPHVRTHGLRLAEKLLDDSPKLRALFQKLVLDADAHVRYQLAFSLGELPASARVSALVALIVRDAANPWMRLAVFSSVADASGEVFQRLATRKSFRSSDAGGLFLASLAEQIGAANRSNEVAAVLKSLENLSDDERGLSEIWVQALARKQKGDARRRLLAASGGTAATILSRLLTEARSKASDTQCAVAERADAIRSLSLAEFEDHQKLLSELLSLKQPPQIQQAALDTLSEFDDERVAAIIVKAWSGLSPALQMRATEVLLSRREWITAFLQALETGHIRRGEVDSSRLELLKQYPDRQIVDRITRFMADNQLPKRQQVIDRYQAALKTSGDPRRGKQLFKKNCSSCHRLEGVGTAVGADLTGIRNRGLATIMVNILDPNREVKTKFLNYVVQTDDGRVLTGMISSESANTLTLRQADGKQVSVPRIQVEALRNTGISFMPNGLEKQLDVSEMADLLAYLNAVR